MRSQQLLVAGLLGWLTMQHVAAVINNGQTKKIEELTKSISSEINDDKQAASNTASDLKAESSENSNRRKAIHKISASTSGGYFNLPVPNYNVPNDLPNNIYPAPPLDTPPPLSKPISSLYGKHTFGKTYGIPQAISFSPHLKGYDLHSNKYNVPFYHVNDVSTNLNPPKSFYEPQKQFYLPPGKPVKYPKYSVKNYGPRLPKPTYETPFKFKDTFSNNKAVGGLYINNFNTKRGYSNLYSGISGDSKQYGAYILPPKDLHYPNYRAFGTGLSTQNDVLEKTIVQSPMIAYGPPQPSPNPGPPHPGAPAPPTPPDIKYDGWQPIPGLVSKQSIDAGSHITADISGYNNLLPPPLGNDHDHFRNSYGLPSVTLDISHETSSLDQPGLQDSYGVPLNAGTSYKSGVSDSYGAPLGTVTGSGGVVASSGAEIHGGQASLSNLNNNGGLQSLNLDLLSTSLGHSSNIEATKSVEYEIHLKESPKSNTDLSFQPFENYGAALPSSISIGSAYNFQDTYDNNRNIPEKHNTQYNLYGDDKSSGLFSSTIGLVPPNGVYGVPQSGQYGTPLYSNIQEGFKFVNRPVLHKDNGAFQSISSNSYLSPPPSLRSGSFHTVPISTNAISFQNVVHGSSKKGLNTLKIEGATKVPYSSYNVPFGSFEQSHSPPLSSGENIVGLDYTHPFQTIDLTQEKLNSDSHNCVLNNQQPQVPSFAYGVPFADSYTSTLSSNNTNIASSQSHEGSDLIGTQTQDFQLLQPQYKGPDLALSSSIKSEAKYISYKNNKESHGINYGKSVAESFGPNSELVESQSIDLNNIPLQGNLDSYTLQIQSADGSGSQVSHGQVLNEGLLQSILQAIEQPNSQSQTNKYPIVLQPNKLFLNDTVNLPESYSQGSEINEVIIDAPKNNNVDGPDDQDDEETLQLLDTSKIALYYKKEETTKKSESYKKNDAENNKN